MPIFKVLEYNRTNPLDHSYCPARSALVGQAQWQQIKGNNGEALEQQMKLFVDPVSKNATTENMVYELLLKSGKDLNSKLEHKENYYCVNDNELIFMLEKATQEIVDAVIKEKPQKVVALDRLFKGND